MKERDGKFFVMEGSDSSGKELQSRRLLESLPSLTDSKIKFLDFPRYESFFGRVIGDYLKGEFGDVFGVHPTLACLPYFLDRYEMKDNIAEWLDKGYILIANRFVGSNLAHMSAKLPENERPDFIKWVEEMEYERYGIPKENLSIFLHVPSKIGQKLTYEKDEKVYMKGKGRGDIHERNLDYLNEVIKQFLWLVENRDHWKEIDCMESADKLRTPEEIHQDVLELVKSII